MLDLALNWLANRVWSRPADWRIRTDDRQVRHLELRRRVLAAGGFRAWQYVPSVEAPERPFRPLWCDVPASTELHVNPMFEGRRLGQLGEEFRRNQIAERARLALDEMVGRIEATAERWWAELNAEVGVPVQGWAT
jgi:hypothetical protein